MKAVLVAVLCEGYSDAPSEPSPQESDIRLDIAISKPLHPP
jgi:hypothetical protein